LATHASAVYKNVQTRKKFGTMYGMEGFSTYLACLQNKSGFFGEPAFIQSIRAIWKVF